ncbi:MAG: hypothetical protein AAB436_04935 [Patescibacteria group bacterium]
MPQIMLASVRAVSITIIIELAMIVVGLILLIALAQAAPDGGSTGSLNLITSPLPISLSGPPGSTLTTDIRIKNGSTHDETLKVTLMKFAAYGEEGKPAIAEREPGDNYFDWVSFSPQTFAAPPNEWVTVKMTVKLPPTAAFGYYYAAVFSRAGAPEKSSGRQNVLVGSTAVLALVEAQVPNAKRTANIASFSADQRFYEFLPATFRVKVHNSGNVHLIPTGNIYISRGDKTVATLKVNSAQGNVLPNSNRAFTAAWKDGFPVYTEKESGGQVVLDKDGKQVTDLKWDYSKASKLRFGHYTAHLLMAYDDGKQDVPLEAVVSFWVIPWRVIGMGLIVGLFAAVGIWSTGRSVARKTKQVRKSGRK